MNSPASSRAPQACDHPKPNPSRMLTAFNRVRASLGRFRRAEEGSYLVYVGIAAIPMVTAAGLGVDVARGYLAEARLQSAIDAAAIAMGSADGTDEEIETLGRTFFYANFPSGSWAEPADLQITVTRVDENDPTSRPESFAISATARVDTLFFRALPGATSAEAGAHYDYVDVAASSTALTEVKGLEVVMVLDVTGSMYSNYSSGERRIEAMRDAALKMVEILFGENPEPELLRVGIVPYNTAVNIGTDMHSFVTDTGLDASGLPTTPNPFNASSWFGCVQARPNGNDLTDVYTPGATDGTGEWPAYRWPIEPDRRSSGSTYNYCEARAGNSTGDYYRYEEPFEDYEEDDPDSWEIYAGDPSVLVPSPETRRYYDRDTDGPNKGCPGPLLPLSNSREEVWNYLQDITVVDGNGTITATGLQWGWRVISPGAPFSESQQGVPVAAYDDIDWEKAIIVLTDGAQTMVSQHGYCDNARNVSSVPALRPPDYQAWSFDPATRNMDGLPLGAAGSGSERTEGPDYRWSAYGYVHPKDSAPLGSGNIRTILENRLGESCDAIKDVEDPINGGSAIKIFAITFGDGISDGDSISTMMRNCTTDTLNNYYHAPDTATLEAAFEEIARQLTSLRLTD